MGYQRNRYGNDDRWHDRDRDYWSERREEGPRARSWDRDYEDDRGFFDRAGDTVRSWFGDEEAERRRERDQQRYERETGREAPYRRDYGFRDRNATWNDERNYGPGRSGWRDEAAGYGTFGSGYVARSGAERASGRDIHDRSYQEWRNRQIDELDRDYDDYRREHQSQFEREFGSWRDRPRGQRQSLSLVTEHMEVVGSDGSHVGTVDKVRGDRIILTKNDENAAGHHHSIPCSWIDKVEDKVTINKTAEEAIRSWRDEDTRRALFEREDQGSEVPYALDRSFAGTYGTSRR